MILCQISDLHIKPEGVLANGGRVDTALALAACLEHILALPQRPDAILASGDLVDAGDPKEYANLVHLLGRLEREPGAPPVYLMPGNHDERSALRDAFPEHRWLRDGGAFIQYAVDLGPLRLVALDTVSPGRNTASCATSASHGSMRRSPRRRRARPSSRCTTIHSRAAWATWTTSGCATPPPSSR